MFWGIISSDGQRILLEGSKNMIEYIGLLKSVSRNFWSDGPIFQQDNCPVHYSKKVLEYLKEKVDILEWQTFSPDLHVIENVWSVMKKRLGSPKVDFQNNQGIVYSVWNDLPTQYFEKLCESIPKSICKCNKNNGKIISYQQSEFQTFGFISFPVS